MPIIEHADILKYEKLQFNTATTFIIEKPTAVARGIFHGFSMPIYDNDDEELFSCVCVSNEWDGVTDPVVIIAVWLASAEDVNDDFNIQLSVETYDPLKQILQMVLNTHHIWYNLH